MSYLDRAIFRIPTRIATRFATACHRLASICPWSAIFRLGLAALALLAGSLAGRVAWAAAISSETSVGSYSQSEALDGNGDFPDAANGDPSDFSWDGSYSYTRAIVPPAGSVGEIVDTTHAIDASLSWEDDAGYGAAGVLDYALTPEEKLTERGARIGISYRWRYGKAVALAGDSARGAADDNGEAADGGAGEAAQAAVDAPLGLEEAEAPAPKKQKKFKPWFFAKLDAGELGYSTETASSSNAKGRGKKAVVVTAPATAVSLQQSSLALSLQWKPTAYFRARLSGTAYKYDRDVATFEGALDSPAAARRGLSGFSDAIGGLPAWSAKAGLRLDLSEEAAIDLLEEYAELAADGTPSSTTTLKFIGVINKTWKVWLGAAYETSNSLVDRLGIVGAQASF
jgi:hypothetical protein